MLRCLASASSSTNEPSSSSARMRSRAVSLPLAWTFSTAASPTGCSVSSVRLRRSASLPAVVWMSISCSAGRLGNARHGSDAIGDRLRPPSHRSPAVAVGPMLGHPCRAWRVELRSTSPSPSRLVWRHPAPRRRRRDRFHQRRSDRARGRRRGHRRGRADRRAPDRRPGPQRPHVGRRPRARRSRCRSASTQPRFPTDAWGWLPLATGVAVVDAVAEATAMSRRA